MRHFLAFCSDAFAGSRHCVRSLLVHLCRSHESDVRGWNRNHLAAFRSASLNVVFVDLVSPGEVKCPHSLLLQLARSASPTAPTPMMHSCFTAWRRTE